MWSSILEGFRTRRSPPEGRLAELGLAKGMKLADVGAGYGFFAFPAGQLVGDEGTVYAVEPDPGRAGEIAKRIEEKGVRNMKVLMSGAEDMRGIADGEVDVAICMSSFHHFSDKERGLAELRRIVKSGGLIYIREMKSGRIFKHGSVAGEFRGVVSRRFPQAEFEEGSGYIVARIRI